MTVTVKDALEFLDAKTAWAGRHDSTEYLFLITEEERDPEQVLAVGDVVSLPGSVNGYRITHVGESKIGIVAQEVESPGKPMVLRIARINGAVPAQAVGSEVA